MSRAKTIGIIGAPSSGKSTLAAMLNAHLKQNGHDSIFVGEYATDYIAKYGVPEDIGEQLMIFEKQRRKEITFIDTKDYVVCDSMSMLSYVYGRSMFKNYPLSKKDMALIKHLHRLVLYTVNFWDYIFYVPLMEYKQDNIRTQTAEEAAILANKIKTYMDIENVPYIDMTGVALEDRLNFVVGHILGEQQ